MLPFLLGLLVAAGPLLRGAWDLWAQSLLFLAVTTGFALWLIARIWVGYLPLPSARNLVWTAGLALLAGLSAALSPVASYAVPAWRSLLLGLWIFPAITAVSKDERAAVDEAIRAGAWILVLLAFYQHYHQGLARPPGTFLNQNVFAGVVLLLLPLSLQRRDWFLAAGLAVVLFWAHSVGAWLGLAGALMFMRRSAGLAAYRLGAAIGLVCLVILYGRLDSPDVLHRWQWWEAAARIVRARPALGFGPGTFAYVLPAYQDPQRGLSTLYAHEHFLETAAECGLPYLLVWCAGLVHCLRQGGAHKRFGALAVLIQSLWDYPLSIPAGFWLFCYYAASGSSESSRGVNIPTRLKLPLSLAAAALALGMGTTSWQRWQADRLKAEAAERFMEKARPEEVLSLLARSAGLASDPETERLTAEVVLHAAPAGDEKSLRGAAAHLERAARLDPYRASTWASLERLYLQLGDPAAAREARRHGAEFCPVLRSAL